MSRTLNMVDHLLVRGRHLQSIGRRHDALRIFSQLSTIRELPENVAEEAHVALVDIHTRCHDHKRARRHLTVLLARQPENARYHFLMATAHDQDDEGNPQTACSHYRRSLELEPDQPDCLADFGLLALCVGDEEEGLRVLRRAAELAPDEPEIIGKVVEGLCELELADEARQVLRAALFRNPRHSGFRKLWDDFQFQQLHEAQESERRARMTAVSGDAPVLLPFLRPISPLPATAARRIRRDPAGPLQPPHAPRPSSLPGRKHA